MIDLSLQKIIVLLTLYKYEILFPISVIEGPIATVIAGFLFSLHIMNWFIIYVVVVLGDITGDTLMYSFGRFGGKYIKKYGSKLGVTETRLESAKKTFNNHHHKTIIASKLVHGIGVSGIVAAGILKIPYVRFIKTCLAVTLLQSALFLIIGIFFGHAYQQISYYFNNYAAIISVVVLAIIALTIFLKIKK